MSIRTRTTYLAICDYPGCCLEHEFWELQEKARIAVTVRDYPTGMLEPIPQQTLDDADTLARIFQCKNYRNDETEIWE